MTVEEKLAYLEENGLSLFIERDGEVVFESREPMLKPLFRLAARQPELLNGAVLVDKIVGRAAAMLAVLGGVAQVVTPMAGEAAAEVLHQAGIALYARRIVPAIHNRDGSDLCPMEKLADTCASPQELFDRLAALIRLD